MTLKQYFIALTIGILLAFLSLILVTVQINPETNFVWGPLLFYVSFFFIVVGSFAIIGFLWRVRILKQTDVLFRQVKKTFRQGCVFGLLVVFALILQHAHLLRWWSMAILIVFALGVEFYAFSKEQKYSSSQISANHSS